MLAEVALALARNRQAPGPLETLKLSSLNPPHWPARVQSPLVPLDPPSTLLRCPLYLRPDPSTWVVISIIHFQHFIVSICINIIGWFYGRYRFLCLYPFIFTFFIFIFFSSVVIIIVVVVVIVVAVVVVIVVIIII